MQAMEGSAGAGANRARTVRSLTRSRSKLSKIGRYDEFHTGGHCIRERKTNRACRCGRSFVSASNCSKIRKDSRASCCRGTRSPHARLSALRLGDEAKNGKTRREYRTEVLGLL